MFPLTLRMSLVVILLFAILYVISSLFMTYGLGIGGFLPHLILAFIMLGFQYLMGPKIVELIMRVKYLKREEAPQLFSLVEDLAKKAGIPTPRLGIAHISLPNAFAFGRGIRDGRVCVTKGILDLLDEGELKAVLGHEITHLKNRDVLVITLLSVIPLLLFNLYRYCTFFSYSRSRRKDIGTYLFLLGIVSLILYFITNLLVLYVSRIREYFADMGAVKLGNSPSRLASALYKLVYGVARTPKEELAATEGIKAFFLNDPSQARSEIKELQDLDLDQSGSIESNELKGLKGSSLRLNFADRVFELLSTHPNMLKRIKMLSTYA